MIVAHIDGGARGNPGPAGYGCTIDDANGKRLAELNDFLGAQTNNFAEYSGLIAALEWAQQHGHKKLRVVSDSELLVKQIKGLYKVRSESLLDIYNEAKSLIRKLDKFEIRHVLRHLNKDADRLANEAMDRGMGKVSLNRANAYERPPQAPELKEVRGIVKNGVVEFVVGESLPDGTLVYIRPARR